VVEGSGGKRGVAALAWAGRGGAVAEGAVAAGWAEVGGGGWRGRRGWDRGHGRARFHLGDWQAGTGPGHVPARTGQGVGQDRAQHRRGQEGQGAQGVESRFGHGQFSASHVSLIKAIFSSMVAGETGLTR